MTIKLLFLFVYFVMMVSIGIWTRKHSENVESFVLGGRNVGPWLSAFAYGNSYFSAVVFVGYAGQFGWKYGLSAVWIGLGNAIIGSLLAWVVLGRRTRVMTQHLNATTMPEFFSKRYDSKAIKITASAITFIFLVPYTASVYNGLSRLFGMAFDIPYMSCVIAMAALTCLYVVLGGYMATAITDFVQGIIMLGGIVLVIGAVLSGQGGFYAAVRELANFESDIAVTAGQPGAFTSIFGPDPLNLLGVIVLTSLGTWGLPQMVHKFYAIRDEKAISTGTVISTVFAVIISGGCYFLGGFGRLFDNPDIYDAAGKVAYDNIIPFMLSKMPDIIIGIVVVLVLSASMSTLAALVMTSSSTLTLDFLHGTVIREMGEKQKVTWMRALIIFFVLLSVVMAVKPPTFIAQLMSISWGALAGSFLAPFLYGLYSRRITRGAVWACFAGGVGITVSNMLFHFISSPINAGAIAMVAGFIIAPVVTLLTPRPDSKHVEGVFSCYESKVTVTRRKALSGNGK